MTRPNNPATIFFNIVFLSMAYCYPCMTLRQCNRPQNMVSKWILRCHKEIIVKKKLFLENSNFLKHNTDLQRDRERSKCQFLARNSRGSQLADNNAASLIGNLYRIWQGHAIAKHHRQRCNDGVTGARDIKHLAGNSWEIDHFIVLIECHSLF